jgi:hypothetical protein
MYDNDLCKYIAVDLGEEDYEYEWDLGENMMRPIGIVVSATTSKIWRANALIFRPPITQTPLSYRVDSIP